MVLHHALLRLHRKHNWYREKCLVNFIINGVGLNASFNSFPTMKIEKIDFFRFLELPTSDAIISGSEQSKWVMFGFVGKLSSCSIFSACQIS